MTSAYYVRIQSINQSILVSEAKTEIMCLRKKGMPESTAIFSLEAAGQVYNQTNEFDASGGTSTTMPTCPSRSTGAYATQHGAGSGSAPSKCTPGRAGPLELKIRMLRAMAVRLRHHVVCGARACHYDTLRRAHHRGS